MPVRIAVLAGLLLLFHCAGMAQSPESPARTLARVRYADRAALAALHAGYDVWEVQPADRTAVVYVSGAERQALAAAGFPAVADPSLARRLQVPAGIQNYPCYRTVEETLAALKDLADAWPGYAELHDVGDSWNKTVSDGQLGFDLLALRLTNRDTPGPKPVFFLLAEIHARELVTAETALRFAEHLLANAEKDPDAAMILDRSEIWILPMSNPDGRKYAEAGQYWRKNTDRSAGGGCAAGDFGVDLNRNSSFGWGGASADPCAETYQGPAPASEPETAAIQELCLGLFDDWRGPLPADAASPDTRGLFITLHSYGNLVLWPFGFSSDPPPNGAELARLGRRFAGICGYVPEQASELYPTTGCTDDWLYGELGIPSFTFEMGGSFFQNCTFFEKYLYPDMLDTLLYAARTLPTPYRSAFGPDPDRPAVTLDDGSGTAARYRIEAVIRDDLAGAGAVTGAECWVIPLHGSVAPGLPGAGVPMRPVDGGWDSAREQATALFERESGQTGRFLALVRGRTGEGDWGPFRAAFLDVPPPGDVDGDGAPGAEDARQLRALLTGSTGRVRGNADADGDGAVTAADLVRLARQTAQPPAGAPEKAPVLH